MELFKKYDKETLVGEHSHIEIETGSPEEKGFWDELAPLLETEIEIPGERFSIEELGNAEFSGDAIDAVGFLFTENE